jgi:hypothetical protein
MSDLFHQSLLLLFCSLAAVLAKPAATNVDSNNKPIGLFSKETHIQNEDDTVQGDIKIRLGDSRFSKGHKRCWRIAHTDGQTELYPTK